MNRFDVSEPKIIYTDKKNRFNTSSVSDTKTTPEVTKTKSTDKITIPTYANPSLQKTDATISQAKPKGLIEKGLEKAQDIIWDIPVVNKVLPFLTGGTKEEINKNANTIQNAKILKEKQSKGLALLPGEQEIIDQGSKLAKEAQTSMVIGAMSESSKVAKNIVKNIGKEVLETGAKNIGKEALETGVRKLTVKEATPIIETVAKEVPVLEKVAAKEPLFKATEPVKTQESLFKNVAKYTKSILGEADNNYSKVSQVVTHDGEKAIDDIPNIVGKIKTSPDKKVNILDYLRTPKYVLEKIGLSKNTKELSTSYNNYLKELPKNLNKVTQWAKQVSKEGNTKIYQWLDGNKSVQLNPTEMKVAGEVKQWLGEWADRLGMKRDERVSDYITHIFPKGAQGEFDEEIAKLIRNKVPGSVYDPFLLQRQGAEGYIEDTWKALDAYAKRATRKVNMDEALNSLQKTSEKLESSQFDYIKSYADRINMRPTKLDTLVDNGIKKVIGYKLGARPTNELTRSARKIVSRAKLGLSFSSALKNLTQGVNTFTELGTKYTAKGYIDLFTKGVKELEENGVLLDSIIQDRESGAIQKFWEKFDKGVFLNFEATEKINRGAAYYGAKAKGLAQGMSEQQAIDYASDIAGKTQFLFGSIDTPLALSSDIMKTAAQFQTFSLKQLEFIGNMIKDKKYASLARYVGSGAVVYGIIGKAFGMDWTDILPSLRFGTPPALDLPVRAYKDITGAEDQYGNVPTLKSRAKDLGTALLTDIVPGGAQIKKTVEGLSTVGKGKSTTSSGAFQYKVKQTPENYIRGALFGRSGLPETQKYYEDKSKKSSKKSTKNRFSSQ